MSQHGRAIHDLQCRVNALEHQNALMGHQIELLINDSRERRGLDAIDFDEMRRQQRLHADRLAAETREFITKLLEGHRQ
ncbi:hypothetical protein GS942_16770 [Rhodococcus hoagii]|nr:hypothetical protein [Prescottella equi]NKW33714.1 hypothetical protein [Prescottella equi]